MRVEALVASVFLTAAAVAGGEIHPGKTIYAQLCSACHGPEGRGNGPAARELDPWPRDFKLAKFRSRSTLSGLPPRRADVEDVVRKGRSGTAMPGFGGLLAEQEIADVVTFVLSLGSRRPAGVEPESLPIPEFPPATPKDRSDGRAIYLVVGCWKCHGVDGAGGGPSAAKLKSDEGQPIRPRDFRYETFRGGRSPQTVARAALSGLIGTPMPSHAEIMVIPREAMNALLPSIPVLVRPDVMDFRREAPAVAEIEALGDAEWDALRDRNLISLVHYVLSLSRREGATYWLFRQEPEREGRTP